jgi:hypothetical protein
VIQPILLQLLLLKTESGTADNTKASDPKSVISLVPIQTNLTKEEELDVSDLLLRNQLAKPDLTYPVHDLLLANNLLYILYSNK